MIRLESETGWWLVTHQDHARLAGYFAEHWGNELFARPEPRGPVLLGIATHDDGWAARDAQPQVTRAGLPAAFSVDLVGKYSAFEEIDLVDYIAVRERAVAAVADRDAYAGLLVSLHTYNLLTARADRATIAAAQLPLLDDFLERQRTLQSALRAQIEADYTSDEASESRIESHFRLLQAADNLSLLACVDYQAPATLLHPLPLNQGGAAPIGVEPLGQRHLRLRPWPFGEETLTVPFPARHVEGKVFRSASDLQAAWSDASVQQLQVALMR